MNKNLQKLARRYSATLRRYVANEQEAELEQAYELGRLAIANELGVLDVARTYQEALAKLLASPLAAGKRKQIVSAAGTSFLQLLSPFEATHRGFRETNVKLEEQNRALKKEIDERKVAEESLRQSREHYRQLFNEAQTMQENLRNLSNKILCVQEEERKNISRELHDEVGQSLTAIGMTLAMLKSNGDNRGLRHRKIVNMEQLLAETTETVHRFSRELRPAMLDELGLLPALRSHVKNFSERTGLRARFRANPIAEKLNSDQKTVLFRIAQESLNNVVKHAKASMVNVTISNGGSTVCLEIADNGKSFAPDAAKNKKRLGLLGMQERVRLVNGQFTVKPQLGKGTTVCVAIPFSPNGVSPAPLKISTSKSKPELYYGKNSNPIG